MNEERRGANKGRKNRLTSDLSSSIINSGRQWRNFFNRIKILIVENESNSNDQW